MPDYQAEDARRALILSDPAENYESAYTEWGRSAAERAYATQEETEGDWQMAAVSWQSAAKYAETDAEREYCEHRLAVARHRRYPDKWPKPVAV